MKLPNTLKTLLLISVSSISCISDNDYVTPIYSCNEPQLISNKALIDIKKNTDKNPVKYIANDIVAGYVISSDEEGNFYKSISIQSLDKSTGLSIPIDNTSLYLNYEPGRKVFIKLKDTYTDLSHDALRVGGLYIYPDSKSSTVGRLSVFEYPNIAVRSCKTINENELISTITIDQVNDSRLNTLLKIENIQFNTESHGRTLYESSLDIGGATNHLIEDATGNQLIFRISSFADFSDEKAPINQGNVIGILTKYKDDYQLIPRFYRDLEF